MSVNAVNSDGSLLRVAGGTLYADAPIGTISPFGGSVVPNGYLLCNGQAVSRTTYAELFAVIGTAFGSGDGSTTFNVPDLREATTKGVGENPNGEAHVKTGGLSLGEFIDDRLQSHTHSIYNGFDGADPNSAERGDARHGYSAKSNNASGRTGNTTEVKAIGVNYIIKAKQVAVPADFMSAIEGYVSEQNDLDDFENITLPVSSVPYDGLLTVSVSNGGYVSFSINARNFTIGAPSGMSDTSEITLKKGDNVGFIEAGGTYGIYVRYYKKRDYSGR